MTELKDILRTEKNLHIKDGTKCLIVYEEQGKTYINKATLYNGGFRTNGVKALLTEDEVLNLVENVGDYFNNFNLEGCTKGTLILTNPEPNGALTDKFSVRRFEHHEEERVYWGNKSLYRKPWTHFYKPNRGCVYYLSGRYKKYAIVNSDMIITYILWHNLVQGKIVNVLLGE